MAPKLDILPAVDRKQAAQHEETVTLLRSLLSDAEAGEITGITCIVELGDDNRFCSTGSDDRYAKAGRIEAMKLRVLGYREEV